MAESFGLGVALRGLPSYPVVQKLSQVLTEHGVVYTRQSTDASGRISLSVWLARAVHYFVMALVCGSHCRCIWVLPVVYDWIFPEMLGTQCLVR